MNKENFNKENTKSNKQITELKNIIKLKKFNGEL